jgi:hypothetical protein
VRRDSGGLGLIGLLLLCAGLYLGIGEVRRRASALRLDGEVVSVFRAPGSTSIQYVGGERRAFTTPPTALTTFALPNGAECRADGGWGPQGSHHTVYLERSSTECFVETSLDWALPGALTLVGAAMVWDALRRIRRERAG